MPNATTTRRPPLLDVRINRPESRNAVDRPTAAALAEAFRAFDADQDLRVAILSGEGSHFCAGADLKAVASGDPGRANRLEPVGDGPMGPTRMELDKPVIAAVSGYCVAGAWSSRCGATCASRTTVPLIDGGTVRLPRLIGHSRAMDMILTRRAIDAREAHAFGLVNRLVPAGEAPAAAEALGLQLAALPQSCMRNDRRSALHQWSLAEPEALAAEFGYGLESLRSGEFATGARAFQGGEGRHGTPRDR